jgi:hypothetical protein
LETPERAYFAAMMAVLLTPIVSIARQDDHNNAAALILFMSTRFSVQP